MFHEQLLSGYTKRHHLWLVAGKTDAISGGAYQRGDTQYLPRYLLGLGACQAGTVTGVLRTEAYYCSNPIN